METGRRGRDAKRDASNPVWWARTRRAISATQPAPAGRSEGLQRHTRLPSLEYPCWEGEPHIRLGKPGDTPPARWDGRLWETQTSSPSAGTQTRSLAALTLCSGREME